VLPAADHDPKLLPILLPFIKKRNFSHKLRNVTSLIKRALLFEIFSFSAVFRISATGVQLSGHQVELAVGQDREF
jgi:hypothetical protein